MKDAVELQETGIARGFLAQLVKMVWGPVLLAALGGQAHAASFGICMISSTFGSGGTSSAQYASSVVSAGCIPGFSSNLVTGAIVNPVSLPSGLTAATLQVSQPMPFGGDVVASSTASLDQGLIRDYVDSQGGVGGCGGTCMTTGGRGTAESLMGDTLHFTITDNASSAIVTLNAHLDGLIGIQGTGTENYNILDQFGLGGSACWGSITGLGFQPCTAGNFGFLTSGFTNQSATGFDFTGTFQVTNGFATPFFAALQVDCQAGALCDFSNTASFSLTVPSNVTFSSDSGVLFSQTGGSTTPEPATFVVAGAALLGLGIRRRSGPKRQ